MAMNEVEDSANKMLKVLLEILIAEFPDCKGANQSIDELIKMISVSFPGKSLSPYKGSFN